VLKPQSHKAAHARANSTSYRARDLRGVLVCFYALSPGALRRTRFGAGFVSGCDVCEKRGL